MRFVTLARQQMPNHDAGESPVLPASAFPIQTDPSGSTIQNSSETGLSPNARPSQDLGLPISSLLFRRYSRHSQHRRQF